MGPVKVVAHYADGRIVKGYTNNFLPDRPSFQVSSQPNSQEFVKIWIKDLKGLCFVRDFTGDAHYQEQKTFPEGMRPTGKAVEVTFMDGEIIVGSTEDHDLQRTGFFLVPADPKSNNLRIFAVSQAVRKVRYIQPQ